LGRVKREASSNLFFVMYDFGLNRVAEDILRMKAANVALQLPEGLKPYALSIAKELEAKTGSRIFILADPCYGGCDVAIDEAKRLRVDLLIHFGHSEMLKGLEIPVIYVESFMDLALNKVIKDSLNLLKGSRIGVVSIIQHSTRLKEAIEVLKEAGKEVRVAPPLGRVKYPGQVLGCDYSSAKSIADEVDSFLFIGGGVMHPLGVRIVTRKPVVAADPLTGKVEDVEQRYRRLISIRMTKIAEASNAKIFGVVLGLKPGQLRPQLADRLTEELTKHGKRTFLLACREVTPSIEASFSEVEVFVITACPLIPLFDQEAYHKPLLTPQEALLAVKGGCQSLEEYEPFKWF